MTGISYDHGTGRAVTGQRDVIVWPLRYAGGVRPVVFLHPANGSALTATSWAAAVTTGDVGKTEAVAAGYGIPVVAGDEDGAPAIAGRGWANDASRDATIDLIEWACAPARLNYAGACAFIATSMGFSLLGSILATRPDLVACAAGVVPVTHPVESYNASLAGDHTVSDAILTAWGTEAAFLAAMATRAPWTIAQAGQWTIPTRLWSAADDAFAPTAGHDAFAAAAADCDVVHVASGGHDAAIAPADDVARFLATR